MSTRDFLVELGTEELPPKALKTLSAAFTQGIEEGLKAAGLSYSGVTSFAAPRRLAVRVTALAEKQADKEETLYGPPANVAFDASGAPTKAALAFAQRAGVPMAQVQTAPESDGKNAGKLMAQLSIKGKATAELLPALVQASLDQLPIAKRMRWGASRVEFVRPAKWLVMLFGTEVVQGEVLGLKAGNQSRGHRFHAPAAVTIDSPASYEGALKAAYVLASFNERAELIRSQVARKGSELGGVAVISDDLLNEVTALNEWPVALAGSFDAGFLRVPPEALVSSMKEHQKYFHVEKDGKLLPNFITVANIESKDPAQVIAGNEKVIRPRLADATFFWDTDRKQTLASRFGKLENVVWVNGLGSIADKTRRISALASQFATLLGANVELVQRAAHLCKNDLVTNMVGEFDDLQGLAGKYYAEHDGEPAEVAATMVEQYMPAFSGDALPSTQTGTIIALADRLDSLVGLFGINQLPTGSRDPFALRRAALGVLRILVEKRIDISLDTLIDWTIAANWPTAPQANTKELLLSYLLDRFSAWYQDENIAPTVFQAVRALGLNNALDINRRVQAVHLFSQLPEASALAAANKRVSNILAKNDGDKITAAVNTHLLQQAEEKTLAEQLAAKQTDISPLLAKADYQAALSTLASLRPAVDAFFDNVMVMAEEEAVRNNRLALLKQLQGLFIGIADISLL
ncbi:MAG: glycyl-tRNA synthetase [Pseudomonadota bacterium]|jgi:glycyl-tRNA synthetase beta chain